MIKLLDITDKHWQNYILNEPDHTIYHHPQWAKVISETYGYHAFAVVNTDDAGEIITGIPLMDINSWLTGKRWVSLPFSDYCKMLCHDNQSQKSLVNGLIHEADNCAIPYIEIRDEVPLAPLQRMQHHFHVHQIDLTIGEENVFTSFHRRRVQTNIRKADKNGIVVTRHTNSEAVDAFYKLHLLTRKKHGVPTQPKKYFYSLFKNIISRDLGFIMLAHCNGQLVNAALFLQYNNMLIYKYAASDPNHMNLRGNHALIWKTIQWGCLNSYRCFCFGRTDSDNFGLLKFKSGWGGTEQILRYSYGGAMQGEYTMGWKQRLMKNIIQKSPPYVGLLLGKLLYKHVA